MRFTEGASLMNSLSNCGKTQHQSRAFAVTLIVVIAGATVLLGQQKTQSGPKLQPLNIKAGLWETTLTITRMGQTAVPAEVLNRLTSEQRARMEEKMNSAVHARTTTHKHCVTREDIEKFTSQFAGDNACNPTIISSTSTKAEARVSCEAEGMKGTGTYEVEALNPERIRGSSHATMSGSGHTMNLDGMFTSKWLGSSCGNVK
jgi:uncharacterized protein DUF3617